jgi:ABC-type transporter Mla subunit MlaD
MRRIAATIGLLGATALVFFGLGSGGSGGSYEVRGIFDNGAFLVPGEDVRIAGATVGSVASVDVTTPEEWAHRDHRPLPGKAVVVMKIDDPGFQDFRRDASCIIRPASLLGEKYVDCQPTQPRAPGSPPPPALSVIPSGEPGTGQRFLPLENNGKQVDLDLVNNIMREPYVDRFRLILNDLGAGLAARGNDLEAVVRRADPALRQTDRLLRQLARQNRTLSRLAVDSDRALAPLARERRHVAGFINNANTAAEATAERSADLEAGFQKFPAALRELRSQMVQLNRFANQARPVFSDLAGAAPSITRATRALGPFARASTPALTSLGDAAEESVQPIVNSDPILVKIRNLARRAGPGAKSLNRLLSSLRKTGGYQKVLSFVFNTVGATNGYDEFGHFLRASSVIPPGCTLLVSVPTLGCGSNWQGGGGSAKVAPVSAAASKRPTTATSMPTSTTGGVPFDAEGDLAGDSRASSGGLASHRHASLGDARRLLDTVAGPTGATGPDGTRSDRGSQADQGGRP